MTEGIEKKVCIPIKEREPNKVDELRDQIKNIQENCKHDFRLTKEPKLSKSLISGVFVGSVEGPTEVSRSNIRLELVCLKCSEENITSTSRMCPKCLFDRLIAQMYP